MECRDSVLMKIGDMTVEVVVVLDVLVTEAINERCEGLGECKFVYG